jgi:hypothetical protein
MTLEDFYDIDMSNLSTMSEKERQKVIKLGVMVYIQELNNVKDILELDFIDLLKSSVYHTEKVIQQETERENYELCYFLKGIIDKVKKEYGL